MVRKSKIAAEILGPGINTDSRLTVLKAQPLLSLCRTDMKLTEFKILDLYLSRINSHDPDKRTVVLSKGEIENVLGVDKINKAALISRIKGLGRMVEVATDDHEINEIALFEQIQGSQDEDGVWTVKLTCTAQAIKYIFNVESLGYLRYKLRNVIQLNSRYSYVLFLYLESNRYRQSWDISVEDLKHILKCDDDASYTQYKRFNDLVLKRACKELQEKTECRFTYTPVKRGRRIVAIHFDLETLAALDEPEQQLDGQLELELDPNNPLALYTDACDNAFGPEQMRAIVAAIADKDIGDELGRWHYLHRMYTRMMGQDAKKPIRNKYEYFLTMLDHDR